MSLVKQDTQCVTIKIAVTDTGIGLSERDKRLLFRPFTQVDGATTRRYGGTGLGLSITKRLVDMMNGSIDVDSVMGKGSTFTFTVALERSPLATGDQSDHGSKLEAHRKAASRSQQNLQGIAGTQHQRQCKSARYGKTNSCRRRQQNQSVGHSLQLKQLGYVGHTVNNGQEAVDAALRTRYSLILMDCQMPEMDGFEATTLIRNSEMDIGRHTQ